MSVNRLIYRAQMLPDHDQELLFALQACRMPESALTLSVFKHGRNLYFYYECTERDFTPDELFPALSAHLETIPFADEARYFVRMYDVFHYNNPTEGHIWRDQIQGVPYARLNRLKPEMLSSYIFYHNQLQEEKPGIGDKYGIIALNENLLFFYEERPYRIEKAPYEGRLNTNNTPGGWGDLMTRHFMPWEDTDKQWREDLELIYFKRCQIIGKL